MAQHCPYCGDDERTSEHILDCQPLDVRTDVPSARE